MPAQPFPQTRALAIAVFFLRLLLPLFAKAELVRLVPQTPPSKSHRCPAADDKSRQRRPRSEIREKWNRSADSSSWRTDPADGRSQFT